MASRSQECHVADVSSLLIFADDLKMMKQVRHNVHIYASVHASISFCVTYPLIKGQVEAIKIVLRKI